jgi:hypothetical protein
MGAGPDHDDDVQNVLFVLYRRWGDQPPREWGVAKKYAVVALLHRRWYRWRGAVRRREALLGDADAAVLAESRAGVAPLDETANPPVARLLGRLGFAVLSARLQDPSVTRVATRLRTSRASVLRVLRRIRRMVSEALESSVFSPG